MNKVLLILAAWSCLGVTTFAQRRPVAKRPTAKRPAAAKPAQPVPVKPVSHTYTSELHRFSITFPDNWYIADDKFDEKIEKEGIDLSLKAPDTADPMAKARLDRSLQNVKILITAVRATPNSTNNAIIRVSTENLILKPQVRDAVDYFDLMRSMFQSMKLPADFKYSETQAEQLGRHQFAFLDVSSNAGKKRMYATVRNRYAIMFTLSYTNDEDLQTLRQILAKGEFLR
ncbi:MAG TPA: hypothetical protein VL327_14675 [Pyrinomonadaceae bacterium]|nr:hypothetical protein [Pyrinomonadaceae bacterium]